MSTDLRWRLADDDAGQPALFAADALPGRRELREVEYMHVRARRLISEVPRASQLPFRYTINVYRGCSHACVYCFARPTHAYLGLDPGEDFERRIVVKVNAVERLRAELASPRWGGEAIAMGTNTDPYQPAEGRYRLTRGVLQTLVEAQNPFSILTKSTQILRDLDVLGEGARRCGAQACLSIGTLDEDVWRDTEPGTPPPARRVEAVARLNEAGVPCGVLVAPLLPGISDSPAQVEAVVRACVEAGATSVGAILLHLRPGVRELYMPWLARERPDLVPLYEDLYGHPSGYARERQRELSATVGRLLDELRPRDARVSRPSRFRRPSRPHPAGAATERPAPAEQLRLRAGR